jgi:hypothetical protein
MHTTTQEQRRGIGAGKHHRASTWPWADEGCPCATSGATGHTGCRHVAHSGFGPGWVRAGRLSGAGGEPGRGFAPWPIDGEIAVLTGEFRPRVDQIRSYDLSGSRGERVRRIGEGESRSTAPPLGGGSDIRRGCSPHGVVHERNSS